MIKTTKAGFLCISLILSACSSQPPMLSPSKKLVINSQPLPGKALPQDLISHLNNVDGYKVSMGSRVITLGENYVSALGEYCRVLYLHSTADSSEPLSKLVRKRVVCKNKNSEQWELVPAIIDSDNETNLSR